MVVLPVQVRPAVTSEFQPPADRRSHTGRQEGIARCTDNSYLVPPGSCQLEIVLSANIRVYLKSSTKQKHTRFHHKLLSLITTDVLSTVGEILRQGAYNL